MNVGLSEAAFWEMTPMQLRRRIAYVTEMREHRAQLEQNANQRAAWICATIMNFAGKQLRKGEKVKPEQLLKKKTTKKDIADARSYLIKRFNLSDRFGIYDC